AVLDVADRARGLLDERRHARVSLAGDTNGEVYGLARPGTLLPVLADRAQVRGEDESGPAAIGARDRRELCVGKRLARIGFGDRRVTPLSDLAEEDPDVGFARELELLGSGWEIVAEHDAAGRHRQQHDAVLDRRHLLIGHGGITGAKVHETIL